MGAISYGLANLFILGGWVLLLVATISAPVIDRISFLDVSNGGATSTFGALGYCTNSAAGACSSARVGYPLSRIVSQIVGVSYENTAVDNATKGLILHPIAAGIAFIAQIIALASNQFGFLCASFIVFLAFLVSATSMALDFALFSIIRNTINNRIGGAEVARFSTGIWLVLAATLSLLVASIFTLFACCCGGDRRERRYGSKHASGGYGDGAYVGNQPMMQTHNGPQRNHWWSRRNRY